MNLYAKYIQFINRMSKQKPLNPKQNPPQQRNNHHLSEFKNEFLTPSKKSEGFHPFSQPKPRTNAIKINKAKLPADFFPKGWTLEKRLPNFKLNLKQQDNDLNLPRQRRVQSERLHNSPEKTSFFGFFDNQHMDIRQMTGSSKKLALKRKFQTREEPKRDNSQMKRRFTPGSTSHRSDLLDLFPATYDQQMTDIVISNSGARVGKFSPRKQYITKYRDNQQAYDPEKSDEKRRPIIEQFNNNYNVYSPTMNLITLKTVQQSPEKKKLDYTFASSETVDLHNMTFFNVKSSSLPPIKKM